MTIDATLKGVELESGLHARSEALLPVAQTMMEEAPRDGFEMTLATRQIMDLHHVGLAITESPAIKP